MLSRREESKFAYDLFLQVFWHSEHQSFDTKHRARSPLSTIGALFKEKGFKYMILLRRALVVFHGNNLFLFWKRRDDVSPYWGCTISLDMAKNQE